MRLARFAWPKTGWADQETPEDRRLRSKAAFYNRDVLLFSRVDGNCFMQNRYRRCQAAFCALI